MAPSVQASITRRWGWWLYAEYRLINMRAYLQTILIRAIGLPLLYLSSMGLGLGNLVDAGCGRRRRGQLPGVRGARVAGVVHRDGGHRRVHVPVMSGFSWRETLLRRARRRRPLIALGEVAAVGLRFIAETVIFWLALLLFGAVVSPASWLVVLIAPLAALAFGAPLLAFAATQTDEGAQFSFIQRFIVMPMFLFARRSFR